MEIKFFVESQTKYLVIKHLSPTNELFVKFEKALEFTLEFTLSLLLHVSVYGHRQGAFIRA